MKNRLNVIIILLLCISTNWAQSSTSVDTSAITIQNEKSTNEEDFYRSYVFLDLDNSLKIKLKFMKHMESNVKSFLIDEFGEEHMKFEKETYIWELVSNETMLYEVKLKKNKLKISFNKKIASYSETERFKNIGEKLKSITSKKQSIN